MQVYRGKCFGTSGQIEFDQTLIKPRDLSESEITVANLLAMFAGAVFGAWWAKQELSRLSIGASRSRNRIFVGGVMALAIGMAINGIGILLFQDHLGIDVMLTSLVFYGVAEAVCYGQFVQTKRGMRHQAYDVARRNGLPSIPWKGDDT